MQSAGDLVSNYNLVNLSRTIGSCHNNQRDVTSKAQRVPDTRLLPDIFSIPDPSQFSFEDHQVYPTFWVYPKYWVYPKFWTYQELPKSK